MVTMIGMAIMIVGIITSMLLMMVTVTAGIMVIAIAAGYSFFPTQQALPQGVPQELPAQRA